jgi:RecA/RadA recombinase
MIIQTLEGIWEDVAKHSDELKGRRVRVTVFENEVSPKPNESALDVIGRISEKQKEMRETSGAETLPILRNGRGGEMFG